MQNKSIIPFRLIPVICEMTEYSANVQRRKSDKADDGIRTRDLRFTKPLLYQLSYVGTSGKDAIRRLGEQARTCSPFAAADCEMQQLYGLPTSVCCAPLLASTCALTFCNPAVSASICFCCCETVAWKSFFKSSTFLCSFRNSLSNIAFTAS